jgi:hypothetical protein
LSGKIGWEIGWEWFDWSGRDKLGMRYEYKRMTQGIFEREHEHNERIINN